MSEDIQNTMILLLGFPGTGKLTIANEIFKFHNFCLIDNHTINNPIFKMLDLKGKPIPRAVWDKVDIIRDIVLDSAKTLPLPDKNFVFTFYAANESEKDKSIYEQYHDVSKARKACFVPVRLTISQTENEARIQSAERKTLMKDGSVKNVAYRHENETVLDTGHKNELTIDVTNLKPTETARLILEHAKKCK